MKSFVLVLCLASAATVSWSQGLTDEDVASIVFFVNTVSRAEIIAFEELQRRQSAFSTAEVKVTLFAGEVFGSLRLSKIDGLWQFDDAEQKRIAEIWSRYITRHRLEERRRLAEQGAERDTGCVSLRRRSSLCKHP